MESVDTKDIERIFQSAFEKANQIETSADVLFLKMEGQGESIGLRNICGSICIAAIRRFQSIISVCRLGHTDDADILNRSLFELYLSAEYVMSSPLPKSDWTKMLKKEFDLICNLSGVNKLTSFTDAEFRGKVYFCLDLVKRIETGRMLLTFCPKEDVKRISQGIDESEQSVVAEIGQEWLTRLQKRGRYLGFSQVKLLAEYCGQSEVYHKIYGILSHPAHGSGSAKHVFGLDVTSIPEKIQTAALFLVHLLIDINRLFGLGCESDLEKMKRLSSTSFE